MFLFSFLSTPLSLKSFGKISSSEDKNKTNNNLKMEYRNRNLETHLGERERNPRSLGEADVGQEEMTLPSPHPAMSRNSHPQVRHQPGKCQSTGHSWHNSHRKKLCMKDVAE